jgi:hypothetical protein
LINRYSLLWFAFIIALAAGLAWFVDWGAKRQGKWSFAKRKRVFRLFLLGGTTLVGGRIEFPTTQYYLALWRKKIDHFQPEAKITPIMRPPRIIAPPHMDGLYHVVSRVVVDRRMIFGEEEKAKFRELLVSYAPPLFSCPSVFATSFAEATAVEKASTDRPVRPGRSFNDCSPKTNS